MTRKTDRQPVKVGGVVRVVCDTTDIRRVTADVVAESVTELGCGCWRMGTTRPGPTMPGPYNSTNMEVIFQVCGRAHDDGSGDEVIPAPLVLRRDQALPPR